MDENKLWSNASYSSETVFDVLSICKFIAFLILTVAFTACTIHITTMFVRDVINFQKNRLGEICYQKHVKKVRRNHRVTLSHSQCCIVYIFIKYTKWYKTHFPTDSGKWCVLVIFRECFEILLQSQALFLYNGTNIFNLNGVFLPNEPKYIKLFAAFIFSNCMISGILWCMYTFNPRFCKGLLFELILYSFDAIFDIFYTLFPLIIVFTTDDNPNVLVAVASLQTNTQLRPDKICQIILSPYILIST